MNISGSDISQAHPKTLAHIRNAITAMPEDGCYATRPASSMKSEQYLNRTGSVIRDYWIFTRQNFFLPTQTIKPSATGIS